MTSITKNDIIGQQILRIAMHETIADQWLDVCEIYIELANGYIVSIPNSGGTFQSFQSIPRRAKIIEGHVRFWGRKRQMMDAPIAGLAIKNVWSQLDDGEVDITESAAIELEDGRGLLQTSVAPQGTGAAGIEIYSVIEMDELKSFGLSHFFS